MGYNITRAKLSGDSKNKFYITNSKTSEKVTRSAELEDIRQCIMHQIVETHPEAHDLVSLGADEAPSVAGSVLGATASKVCQYFEYKCRSTLHCGLQ
jgi:hypothetical protein